MFQNGQPRTYLEKDIKNFQHYLNDLSDQFNVCCADTFIEINGKGPSLKENGDLVNKLGLNDGLESRRREQDGG